MAITPIQNVRFDDAATLAMGEAFDHACKSLQGFGSAVPAIVANFIIAAAKNGERDPGRLYEQVLADYGIEDTSMPLIGVGGPSLPTLRSRTQPDQKPGFLHGAGLSSYLPGTGGDLFRFKLSVRTNP